MTTTPQSHRYLIIGAGPAGLQLSYYLQQAGADYATLEREVMPAHFFRQFPRHRRLISLNKVHTRSADPEIRLRWDWNSLLSESPELLFPKFSTEYLPHADDLTRYLEEFQRLHGLNVRYGVAVAGIERTEGGFLVSTPGAVFMLSASPWRQAGECRMCPRVPGSSTRSGFRLYLELGDFPRHALTERVPGAVKQHLGPRHYGP